MKLYCLLLLITVVDVGATVAQEKVLPQGDRGIAARYPGDTGIESDEGVVFREHFNDALSVVKMRWESVHQEDLLSIDADVPNSRDGNRSLLVTHLGGESDGAHLYRRLGKGYDKLHYRFYVKFDSACAPIHHFFHVGGYAPPTAWPQGGAGVRPSGTERFTTGVEPFGNNWQWDYYSYWRDMRGSPPRGQCWGNSFIHDPTLKVTKGAWQCLELMMKMNDVGQSNGEMALWIDGRLVSHLGPGFPRGKWVYDKFLPGEGGEGVRWSDDRQNPEPLPFGPQGDPFSGFVWRDSTDLDLNFLWLLCYITKAPPGHVSKIWFDDIVVARDYIGPVKASPH